MRENHWHPQPIENPIPIITQLALAGVFIIVIAVVILTMSVPR
jgi:hypothetical protein